MKVAWDPRKDDTNREKYGLSFEQAAELFTAGNDYPEVSDEAHSDSEERFIAIRPIRAGLVRVVWTERDEDVIRVVSARWAAPGERDLFQRYFGGHR